MSLEIAHCTFNQNYVNANPSLVAKIPKINIYVSRTVMGRAISIFLGKICYNPGNQVKKKY